MGIYSFIDTYQTTVHKGKQRSLFRYLCKVPIHKILLQLSVSKYNVSDERGSLSEDHGNESEMSKKCLTACNFWLRRKRKKSKKGYNFARTNPVGFSLMMAGGHLNGNSNELKLKEEEAQGRREWGGEVEIVVERQVTNFYSFVIICQKCLVAAAVVGIKPHLRASWQVKMLVGGKWHGSELGPGRQNKGKFR